jgi:hypothetical protein
MKFYFGPFIARLQRQVVQAGNRTGWDTPIVKWRFFEESSPADSPSIWEAGRLEVSNSGLCGTYRFWRLPRKIYEILYKYIE